jgi:hypothetical protein
MVGQGQDQLPPEQRKVYSWFGIGHALSMVPFYGLGQLFAAILPGVEERAAAGWREPAGNVWRAGSADEFWPRFFVSLHSPLFAALSVLLLFALLRRLGFEARDALWAVCLAALTTQFWPESRQSMSDTTAGFFLLLAFERSVRWRQGGPSSSLVVAGLAGGFAVACRVPHLLPLFAIGAYVLFHAARQQRWRGLLSFAAAALPIGLLLLVFNLVRFGKAGEFGYSAGTAHGYWNFPFQLGFPLLGISPGKGVLWFSPLLGLAFYGLWRLRKRIPGELLVALSLLLLPWLLNSFTAGWHSSQAWGVRYLTTGAFVVVALGSAALLRRAREQGRRPRWLVAVALLGLFFQLGGVLTPYRGYYELGFRAIAARWPEVPPGDHIQYLVSEPRMSPLYGHWLYLLEDLRGELHSASDASDRSDSSQAPSTEELRERGAGVYRRVYGTELHASAELSWPEDHGLRHLWPIGVSERLGSGWPLLPASLLLLIGLFGTWRLARLSNSLGVLQVPTANEDERR